MQEANIPEKKLDGIAPLLPLLPSTFLYDGLRVIREFVHALPLYGGFTGRAVRGSIGSRNLRENWTELGKRKEGVGFRRHRVEFQTLSVLFSLRPFMASRRMLAGSWRREKCKDSASHFEFTYSKFKFNKESDTYAFSNVPLKSQRPFVTDSWIDTA